MKSHPTKSQVRSFFASLNIECAYSGRRRVWYIKAKESFKLANQIELLGLPIASVVCVEAFA